MSHKLVQIPGDNSGLEWNKCDKTEQNFKDKLVGGKVRECC